MDRPLKIAKVIPYPLQALRFGGPVVQAQVVCRELAARGHEVRVITTDIELPQDIRRNEWIENEGYHIYYASTSPHHRMPPYYTPSIRRPLREILDGTDVVQTNIGLTLTNDMVRKLTKRAGVPYVYNAEGALCPKRMQIKSFEKKLFRYFYENRIVREAAVCQAVSQYERDTLMQWGVSPERIAVIPNGFSLPPIDTREAKMGLRQQLGYTNDDIVILFMGRISPIKGIDLLLNAFDQISDEFPNAQLMIAGPDEGIQATLKKFVQKLGLEQRVRFSGLIGGEEKTKALQSADIFALTSHSEGLPNAVIEGLGYGLAMLLTLYCNVPEIEEYDAGYIADTNVGSIASRLRLLLGDDRKRLSCQENARRLAQDRFSLGKVINDLEKVYYSIAKHPDRTRSVLRSV
ncbi:glycosyltransferase [Bremerella alba]|uniref:D-inositol-3-phosphate glycosyltransferase n=1 Tax=Bremerella alba TaxID=980252 RepID=A0A7V9A538_9BACT|nr:glycosyltransferase [Bremerella alba]MBA2112925.1 D-inositol-3-phosphate glycosyltransferase [Bremerella alba]